MGDPGILVLAVHWGKGTFLLGRHGPQPRATRASKPRGGTVGWGCVWNRWGVARRNCQMKKKNRDWFEGRNSSSFFFFFFSCLFYVSVWFYVCNLQQRWTVRRVQLFHSVFISLFIIGFYLLVLLLTITCSFRSCGCSESSVVVVVGGGRGCLCFLMAFDVFVLTSFTLMWYIWLTGR